MFTARLRRGFLFHLIGLFLLLSSHPAPSDELSDTDPARSAVTPDVIEAKIKEVEAATSMEEQARTKLVELYRKVLSNLQTASSHDQAAENFRRSAETAPSEMQTLRETLEKPKAPPPEESLDIDLSAPLNQIEQLLQKEKADLVAVDAKRADLEKRLDDEAGRPELIRERLTEARQQQEDVAARLKLPPPADEGPATTEARRWSLETRFQALSTEIKMLDQELLSQPVRVDLLKAKRDKAAASVQWVGTRVKLLEDLLNRKRQADAEQARADAEATRRNAAGKHPLVAGLAEQNASLSEELALTASHLNELAAQVERADKRGRQIEEDFQLAKETFEIGGLGEDLGHMLYQQRQSLPDPHSISRVVREREKKAAETGLRRVRHGAEARRLRDVDAYVAGILEEAAAEDTPSLNESLQRLAKERKELLNKAIELDDSYLRKFAELDTAQRRALDAIKKYDAFLDEHLLWARSSSRTRFEALGALPEQVWRIFSPSGWAEVGRTLAYQATHSPVFALLALVLGALLWRRRRIIEFIRGIGDKLGKPTTDRFSYSLQVLALTLLAAAAWPLVTAAIGWQLEVSIETTDFSSAVGRSLIAVAEQFFYLRAFRLICMPGGLAAEHFRWPESSLRLLRIGLDRLSWIFLPAALVTMIAFHLDPLNVGWVVGRVAFLIMVASLAFAFYRLLNPQTGVLAGYLRHRDRRTFARLHRIWYPLLVAAPLLLGSLVLWGYLYTAGTLVKLLLDTAWLIVWLVLLNALIMRWLLVTRRRLVYEAAMERREAELEGGRAEDRPRTGDAGVPIEVEEPEVDLVALSDTSRDLIRTALFFTGFLGLLVIWSEVLPALRILDSVTLWHSTAMVDGEEQVLPVTLADIGMALLYLVLTVILASKLPAALEIILIHRSGMSAGSRYTVTTLTSYAVVTIGAVLVFKTIGADWSKLQWLVAALGVGIGFGLQEIVTNFISGIIILFERPVRVGDVVTVGETDGVVTRIRIRATTIQNWDGKELLVPNKEFITGRLLNWSLSDQTTRILISVGIAYGSNVREAMRLLEQTARENQDVLRDPAPSVIFESFGDNALTMVLRCFVESVDLRIRTISALNEAINDKFNEAGIVIAFPQRDLHLDTTRPLQVELRRPGPGAGRGSAAEDSAAPN